MALLGHSFDNPFFYNRGTEDLTEEEYDAFIKRALIITPRPIREGGDALVSGRTRRGVNNTEGDYNYRNVPREGYLLTGDPPETYTLAKFYGQIFPGFKKKPPFKGVGTRVHNWDEERRQSSTEGLGRSINAKRNVLADDAIAEADKLGEYLERVSPEGIMYFLKPVNGIIPTAPLTRGNKQSSIPDGALPRPLLFWPPPPGGALQNRDYDDRALLDLLKRQPQNRFDCTIVKVNWSYLKNVANLETLSKYRPAAERAARLNASEKVQMFLEGIEGAAELPRHGTTVGLGGNYDVRDLLGADLTGTRYVAISVFSWRSYLNLRKRLLSDTRKFDKAFAIDNMAIDLASGTFKPSDEMRKKQDAWYEDQRKRRNAGNPIWHKKKPDYKGLLKLRLENSQALLIHGMHKMVRLNGILPELKNKVANKNSAASATELKQMIPECLKTYVSEPQSLVDLLANPFGVEEFLCARPSELAFLQPRLQFYLNDVPVQFPDYTDGDRVVQLAKSRISNVQSLQKIFNSTGVKGSDVGIKSFEWGFSNKHHGDSTLKASLTLYFANTTELLNQEYLKFVFGGRTDTEAHRARARKANKGKGLDQTKLKAMIDSRVKVMSEPSAFYGEKSPYSGDLVESKALGTRRGDPPPQLKVQVGWSVPNDKRGTLSEKFKEGVVRTQRLLNLHLWQYNINFGETGDVTLTLDYIGGIDEFLSTPDKSNIFDTALDMSQMHSRKTYVSIGQQFTTVGGAVTGMHSEPAEQSQLSPIAGQVELSKTAWKKGYLHKQLNDGNNVINSSDGIRRVGVSKGGLLYELQTLRLWKKALIAKGGKKPPPSVSEEIKTVSGYMKPLRQALAEVERSHADTVYSSFISKLVSSGKLYYATARKNLIDGTAVGSNLGNRPRTPYGGRVTLGSTFGKASVASGGKLVSRKGWEIDVRGGQPASVGGVNTVAERFQRMVNHNSGLRSKGNFSRTGFNFLDPTQQDGKCLEPAVDNLSSVLYYMKLGDILDIVLCGLQKKPNAPSAEYILGSFYPHKLGVPNTSPGELYSLRDIPISLDYFGHWFMKSFLTKQTKPKASFKRFSDALMTDLVAPLFNRVLRDTTANNLGRMSFGFTALASPVKLGSSPLVNQSALRSVAQDKRRGNNAALDQSQYYLMYLKQINPKLEGNRSEDQARGIYHLVLGSDRGIVKSFAFNQVDLPYYKEMMIEQGNFAEGLFIPQNVTITMVGNTFFRNGQTVYVNADFGLGVAAQKLGIGGYYTVVRVENSIGIGRFETRIQCQFVKRLGG